MSVKVDAVIGADTDLFGKVVSDLQENIVVGASGVSGTLKYVADYSSAYGAGENSGHYLVLHCTTPGVEGATITSEVVGGTHGPVTLDEDGIVISRIADKDTQTIEVVAYKDGETATVTLDLSQLVLAAAPTPAGLTGRTFLLNETPQMPSSPIGFANVDISLGEPVPLFDTLLEDDPIAECAACHWTSNEISYFATGNPPYTISVYNNGEWSSEGARTIRFVSEPVEFDDPHGSMHYMSTEETLAWLAHNATEITE